MASTSSPSLSLPHTTHPRQQVAANRACRRSLSVTPSLQLRAVPHSAASSSSSLSPNVALSRWASKLQRMTWNEWLEFFLPCYRWIHIYKWREYFQVESHGRHHRWRHARSSDSGFVPIFADE